MTLILEICRSFRALPLWVQIWVALILVPVNMASLWFSTQTMGALVAVLAIGGMLPNLLIMGFDRGFSKAMGLPHLAVWVPLMAFLIWFVQSTFAQGSYLAYLWLLLVVNGISLAFDIPDSWKWLHGDRKVAGRS